MHLDSGGLRESSTTYFSADEPVAVLVEVPKRVSDLGRGVFPVELGAQHSDELVERHLADTFNASTITPKY